MAFQYLNQFIRQFSESLSSSFPDRAELGEALRDALTAALQKLELVTRQEFDVQMQLLAGMQEKLLQLEQKVAALENPADKI